MLKKIFRIVTYSILFLILLVLADFYKQMIFIFLIMLLIALVPASYYACKKGFLSLCPFLNPASLFSVSGDSVMVSLGLDNNSLFPLPNCTLTYSVTSSFYPCDQIFKCNIPAYSKRDFSFDIPVTFHRCGCYQLRLTQIECEDYLGFFSFKKAISIQKEIVIHPKQVPDVTFDASSFGEGFDEFEETEMKGLVSSNVTDIREYIPGDRLQSIHWKLSAKIDKLMVKEHEQTSSNQFTVLAELYLPTPDSALLEQSLANAYSMAVALLSAGEAFFFCYYCLYEEDFAKHLIRSKEDFEQALLDCFYQTPYQDESLALDILEKTGLLKGTILHVDHKGVSHIVS